MADDIAATLTPIRERRALVAAANLKADAFGDVYAAMVQLAREDSAFLLAAIEAALKLADDLDSEPRTCRAGCHDRAVMLIREAIGAALTGAAVPHT